MPPRVYTHSTVHSSDAKSFCQDFRQLFDSSALVWNSRLSMKMRYPKELIKGLEAYGLEKKEAKVYLAGLELGAASVLELSRRTNLPRTTLYPILERLTARGVFRLGKKKKTTVYTAELPERLASQMHERTLVLEQALPSLELLADSAQGGPGVTFYEGTDGFKRLWRQIYESDIDHYRLITSGVGLLDYVKEPYLVERVIAQRIEKGIHSRQLIPKSRVTQRIVQHDAAELRESRFLPPDVTLPSTVIIFAEQVAFITTRRENTMVLLASGDIARTYKTLFDLVWEGAEKPEIISSENRIS